MPKAWRSLQVSKRAPEEYHKVIPATSASKFASSKAQIKYLYANTCNRENKQEELETNTCLQDYGLIGIMDVWWDGSYDWNVEVEGYRHLEKTGRENTGVLLFMSMTSWNT